MLDKSSPLLPLSGLSTLTLRGADAARFAQAQFMNDVAALPAGHWQWNGWLTPKGRVIALFALLKRAEDELVLVLLDAAPAGFCAALGRFVFRSKVQVSPCPALLACGRFAAPEHARGNMAAELAGGGLELDVGGAGGARTLRLTPSAATKTAARADWVQFDLAHGLPRLQPGQAEHWTPQQLSLQRLNAYSVKKGCYPGQEIVARTHFLGQAKRGLVRLTTETPIPQEASVEVDDNPPAALIAHAGCEALAVLALNAGPEARYLIGGHTATRQPLLDGLAR